MVDLTQHGKANEKKTTSIAAHTFDAAIIEDATLNELFNIPDRSIITNAYFLVHTPAQSGVTVDVGIKGGAMNELFNDLDIDGTPNTPVFETRKILGNGAGLGILTGTGKTVAVQFSAKPTAGRFTVVVEFIEYALGNGNLMAVKV